MGQLVSQVYGKAFFDLSLEINQIDNYQMQANNILNIMKNDDKFFNIIIHPEISQTKKFEIFSNVFKDSISEHFYGLFDLLLKKYREIYFLEILEDFIIRINEYKGIVVAEVISAQELSDDQKERLISNLSKNLNKKITLKTIIDENVIGGLKIIVDGRIIDGTIQSQIKNIRNKLYNTKII